MLIGKRLAVVGNARISKVLVTPDLEFNFGRLHVGHRSHRVLQQIREHQFKLNRIGKHIGAEAQVRVNNMLVLAVAIQNVPRIHRKVRTHKGSFLIGGVSAHQVDHFGGLQSRLFNFGERINEYLTRHITTHQSAPETSRIIVDNRQRLLELVGGHARECTNGA